MFYGSYPASNSPIGEGGWRSPLIQVSLYKKEKVKICDVWFFTCKSDGSQAGMRRERLPCFQYYKS